MRGSSGWLVQLAVEGYIEGKKGRGRPRRMWSDDVTEWTGCGTIGMARKSQAFLKDILINCTRIFMDRFLISFVDYLCKNNTQKIIITIICNSMCVVLNKQNILTSMTSIPTKKL